jgi:hypothetical protein
MTILAIVVSREDPSAALRDLHDQSIVPDSVTVSDHRFPDRATGLRVAKSLNRTLSEVPWRRYEYVLRIDGDSRIPPDFVQRAISEGADVVGSGASGLLFKTRVLEAMGGRWPEVEPEDSYFIWKAQELGFSHRPPVVRGRGRAFGNKYDADHFLSWGRNCYLLGFEPIYFTRLALASARSARRPAFLFAIPVYLDLFLMRSRRFDIADFVTRTQVLRLAGRPARPAKASA